MLDTTTIVGKGFCADVHAWGEGRVLKLFHGPGAAERAGREYAATRAVHAAGLPVPATFDLIEVEGRSGIVFERVHGVSLFDHTQSRPWTVFAAVRLLAELHARIHRCPAPTELPTQRDRLAVRVESSDSPASEKAAALARLAALPEGTAVCHGDFHPGNVMLTPRGPVVIDWSSASRGDPLGDVAYTSWLLRTAVLPDWAPGYMHLMLRCLRSVMHRAYLSRSLRLHRGTRRAVEGWELPLAVAGRARLVG
jgi:Ser/Thr protein kinase RdoA (MazF antagonist)